MKQKRRVKLLLGAALLAALTVIGAAPAFASGTVTKISLSFTDHYETGEILEPDVTLNTSGVSIDSLEWGREVENWKPGSRVTATLFLSCTDGRSFSSTYGEKSLRVYGGKLSSARSENGQLKVVVAYYPVVQLDSPDEAGWSNAEKTKASWKKSEYATGYKLRLYRDGEYIRTINVTGTSKDLTEYLTKEGVYSYEVCAVGKDSDDAKYRKASEYILSSDRTVDDLGDVEGRWRNYSAGSKYQKEDGSYAINEWYKILGKWYYFGGEGYKMTGWVQPGGVWYYLDANGEMLTGWQQINNVWYFFDEANGAMATGWQQTAPNQWYYLNADGSMAANTIIDGKKLNESGLWVE